MEVVSPSGHCNNKLRPLPQPARHPLVELVDGVLVVCGDLGQCWTYSQGNDTWLRTGKGLYILQYSWGELTRLVKTAVHY